MRDIEELFAALGRSAFRGRFKLGARERAYLEKHGMEEIESHARRFVKERLGAAEPANDGKQTPMRNHPVFVAQHATATCCRGCMEKWHRIPKGRELSDEEIEYTVRVIMRWLRSAAEEEGPSNLL